MPPPLIAAAKKAGVPRLLVVGGAGSLEVAPGKALVDTPEFPAAYKAEALAGRAFLEGAARREGTGLDLPLALRAVRARRAHRQLPPRRRPACWPMRTARAGSRWRTTRSRWPTRSRRRSIRASASPSATERTATASSVFFIARMPSSIMAPIGACQLRAGSRSAIQTSRLCVVVLGEHLQRGVVMRKLAAGRRPREPARGIVEIDDHLARHQAVARR